MQIKMYAIIVFKKCVNSLFYTFYRVCVIYTSKERSDWFWNVKSNNETRHGLILLQSNIIIIMII